MKPCLFALVALFLVPRVQAQLVTEATFDPSATTGVCGLGFDDRLWVYGCFASTLDVYEPDGTLVTQVPRPGNSANDVDVDIAPESMPLGGTTIPAGSVLFFDGESGVCEVYAVDPAGGALLATLVTTFGNSHVVGGAYHAGRDTLFLLQDRVPGSTVGNLVAEVDPVTGAVLNTFSTIAAGFDINFGDIEVLQGPGNLFLVSSNESAIAEFSPAGVLVQEHALPSGVSGLSGIALDDDKGRAWVSSSSGTLWLLAGFVSIGTPYCGPSVPNSSGASAVIRAFGSPVRADDCLSLGSTGLPTNQFGYFLNSESQGAFTPPNSQGVICVAGAIGRYNAAVGSSGAGGSLSLTLDLGITPTPMGTTSIAAGQTWHFQCWFRDSNPGQTSNFTNAVSVTFM